jgi:hypothetical protein
MEKDTQDWTPVTIKRNRTKKESIQNGNYATHMRNSEQDERTRMAKLETLDTPVPKKRIIPSSMQELIRKRIEMKLTQDKADALCAFPKHTFRDIESNRYMPNEQQKRRIQINLNINLKIETI